MTTVAQLTIEMAANVARLREDMARATYTVDGAMNKIRASANGAMKALGAIGVGLSVAGFAAFVRGGIAAGDEMSKLSQKAGVAVGDVAGLQLAFRQSGLQAGDLQGNLSRLNKSIADGSKAFNAMGISTTKADGSLKGAREVLGEVADKFAQYEDGAGKARLAQELFGKSGADMIPLLNGGSAALDDFDAMAKKLGLTMEEDTARRAEKFNDTLDLMGLGVQGISRQLAAQLLPTLSGLAGQFFDNMTKGDRLKRTADFLSSGLKGLYVVALGVVEVFSSVGKTLGGVSAAVVAALRGDFAGAANILRDMKSDIGSGWKDTLAQMQAAWGATGNASVEAMAGTQAALRKTAPELAKTAGAVKAVVDEFARLRDKINAKDSGTEPDFIKNLQILKTAYEGGRMSLQEYLRLSDLYVASQPYMVAQTKAQEEAQRQAAAATADAVEAQQKAGFALQDEVARQREYVAALGLSKEGIAELEAARLQEQATSKDRLATLADEVDWSGQMGDAYRAQAKALRELAQLKQEAGVKEALFDREKKAMQELTQAIDGFGKQATDAFVDFAMTGKGSFKSLADSIIADILRMLVYKQLMQPLMGAISGGIGGFFGGGAAVGSISNGMSQSAMLASQVVGFSGGGYTGSRPRSGGMDGEGGFLAMLHPQETVVDHAKGQSAGPSVNITINNTIGSVASQADVVTGMQAVRAQIMGQLNRSMRYGGAAA